MAQYAASFARTGLPLDPSRTRSRGSGAGLRPARRRALAEGNEELADWKAQLYQIVGSTINQSARFRTINKDFLDVAFREAQISTNDVYLPRGRRALAAALEQQGVPVELLLLPTLTTGTTNAGQGESQKNYLLGLVLVDIASGEEVANVTSPRIRKEYTR